MKKLLFLINIAIVLLCSCNKKNINPEEQNLTEEGIKFEAVDLGLSVKWASCNVGANTPEEYGDYFAWGETETRSDYQWFGYKFGTNYSWPFTKYNTDSLYGTVDNKTVLDPEDDVAHVKLGGKWRMPTEAEWTELRENCTWTWTDNYNGTGEAGRVVNASNGISIFLPAAGKRQDAQLHNERSFGYYWSSSLIIDRPRNAYYIYFDSDNVLRGRGDRCLGFSIRPVCPKD